MINFNCTPEEMILMQKIRIRAMERKELRMITCSLELEMDINAAHSNGCPMDLEKFLLSDDENFFHDVIGIMSHIDRKTGKLMKHFLPRCAV